MDMEKIKSWACQVAQECIAYGWWSWEMARDWVRDYGDDVIEVTLWADTAAMYRFNVEV